MSWLPDGFAHPEHVELATGHHLRPPDGADALVSWLADRWGFHAVHYAP